MSGITQTGRSLRAAPCVKIFGRGAGLLLVLLALTLSCNRNDVVISKILIDKLPGAERLSLERALVREWTENEIRAHGKFRLKPESDAGGTLSVAIGSDRPSKVYLALRYHKDGIKAESAKWVAFDGAKAFRAVFDTALREMLDDLLVQVRDLQVKNGAIQAIRDYVDGKRISERAVLAAMDEVEQRRDLDAVRWLIAVLKQDSIQVSLKAMSVLGSLGDRSAVHAITEFAERKIPEIRRHAIEALRKIGGRSAAAWLFTLSTGHSDVEVRNAAALALKEVESSL